MRVLVTGANGFVGRAVCDALWRAGCVVRAAVRSAASAAIPSQYETVVIGEPAREFDWTDALRDVEVVVHLAARVHVMSETDLDPDAAFRRVNVALTRSLAEQARRAGVSRFVFMSSIKVNGERTDGKPFAAADVPRPYDAYARSKYEAEQSVSELEAADFAVATIRPPLVYGPGVAANFRLLLRLAGSGLPLPLRSINNARSLISVWNLADFVLLLATHPARVSGVWLVSDGRDVSTSQLIRQLARALGRRPILFPVPVFILRTVAAVLGKYAEVRRLTESLQIDSGPAQTVLGWSPSVSVEDGLARTAKAYLVERERAEE